MAQPTNTTDTYDVKGIREDLSDVIYRISPTETPFMSMAAQATATATLHEWQTEALAAADGTNAHIEGDDSEGQAGSFTTREVNYTQISKKVVVVTGTVDAVKKAGRDKEYTRQMLLKGLELKRDMETVLLQNQARVVGDATTARKLRSIDSWYTTNVSRGTGGSNGSASAAATDASAGNLRAFTEDLLKSVLQLCYESGGNPTTVMMGSKHKQVASGFAGNSTRTDNSEDKKLVAAVDIYESDFGKLKFVPNRFQRTREVHVLEMGKWAVAYISGRKFLEEPLAKTGDSKKAHILSEYTLEARNQAASGIIADLSVPA